MDMIRGDSNRIRGDIGRIRETGIGSLETGADRRTQG